jgi:hypothetical protein
VSAQYGQRHLYENHVSSEPDPLTDSAVHRLGLGTMVRLHLYQHHVDVGLLTIRDCSSWSDLTDRVMGNLPIEVLASRRRVFSGGIVLWAEVLSDPEEETPKGQ